MRVRVCVCACLCVRARACERACVREGWTDRSRMCEATRCETAGLAPGSVEWLIISVVLIISGCHVFNWED